MKTSVDWLRRFKIRLISSIISKTSWGKNELEVEINRIYQETLEEMISPDGEQ